MMLNTVHLAVFEILNFFFLLSSDKGTDLKKSTKRLLKRQPSQLRFCSEGRVLEKILGIVTNTKASEHLKS